VRRVVISGLGVVSPLGSNPDRVWEKASAGRSGVGTLTRVKPDGLRSHVAGEVRDYRPEVYFDSPDLELLDRFAQFATIAHGPPGLTPELNGTTNWQVARGYRSDLLTAPPRLMIPATSNFTQKGCNGYTL
jgi:Beta-ketoacyl synthase, N-terminal domain